MRGLPALARIFKGRTLMLSIIDLLDFIDLDRETVQIVNDATRVSDAEATEMARPI